MDGIIPYAIVDTRDRKHQCLLIALQDLSYWWFKILVSNHFANILILVLFNCKQQYCYAKSRHLWEAYGHYDDVIMGAMAFQITSLTIVYSTVYSDADQRTHQTSASLAFVRGIHPGPVNSPHKWPVTREMFPFDDVIMVTVTPRSCSWTLHKVGHPTFHQLRYICERKCWLHDPITRKPG